MKCSVEITVKRKYHWAVVSFQGGCYLIHFCFCHYISYRFFSLPNTSIFDNYIFEINYEMCPSEFLFLFSSYTLKIRYSTCIWFCSYGTIYKTSLSKIQQRHKWFINNLSTDNFFNTTIFQFKWLTSIHDHIYLIAMLSILK